MLSKWACIIVNIVVYVVASEENESSRAFIKLTELAYEDSCSSTAQAEWEFVNSPSNKTLLAWEEKLISYATFKKLDKDEVTDKSKDNITDKSVQYKFDVADKIGDALLDTNDFRQLVHFAGTTELLRLSKIRNGVLNRRTRNDVERMLSHENNVELKNTFWKTWHQELAPLVKNYSTVLPLVDKAAKANGVESVSKYWELLSGYSEGYEKIKYEWSKIADLHKKILKFVITNLSQKYNITINETIPISLLGSLQGSDWTTISVDATPYPELVYNIKKNLWKRKLIGKSMYKTASIMSSQILSQVPHADFWDKSHFDQQCPSKLINFCKKAVMSVSTCFSPTISNYLSAHKNVGKIAFNQISVDDTSVLVTANRYSALEEAVTQLFGILAASPAWLSHTNIMDNSTDNEQRLIVSLMITALNTLPRIGYYMAADLWRINATEKENKTSEELVSSWWQYREKYEGVNSNGPELPTFLDDDYIISNKPYLPKIAGTILAFQLYEYLMESTEIRYDSIVVKQMDINFLKMIRQGSADDWSKIMDKYLEIDRISSDSLLSFFSPLEDYIDELDEDFKYKAITAKESELEELEKEVIAEINAPPATTTTTTTTPKTVMTKTKITNATSWSKQNDGRSDINAVANSDKNLESKSSIHIPREKPENRNILKSVTTTEVPVDESVLDNLDAKQNKIEPYKITRTVLLVCGVLILMIIICASGFFCRRLCCKAPKNRRYV